MIHEHPDRPDLVLHDCPNCGRRLPQPFARGGPPIIYFHYRKSQASCRLIVQPGVTTITVPNEVSAEDVLVTLLDEAA